MSVYDTGLEQVLDYRLRLVEKERDALRARVAELERLGDDLSGHVRNCGGCIGCDEAHAAWRKARKP